jgi:trans-aconitate 2-methyltransferase
MPKYQFTDTDLAAKRLEYLARVYAASSREFIQRSFPNAPRCAVDLGCGPGYTTEMLKLETGAEAVVGLDNSEKFIALAESRELEGVSFRVHDVTTGPFPVGPADIAYCRLLLSHLPNLSGCLSVWADQIQSGGLLLVEEVETIHTTVGEFQTYLEIVDRLLGSQGALLYVGPEVNQVALPDRLEEVSSSVRAVPVSVRDAATMFHMNIQSWKHQPYVQETYSEAAIQSLQDRLACLASDEESTGEIRWGLRQMVLRRQ